MVLGWIFLQSSNAWKVTGFRWGSLICSALLLVYYFAYHLYMYYDLFQYPCAHIRTRSYLNYATKYGCYLSHLRYEESLGSIQAIGDNYLGGSASWSPKIWFRPYNYHILSFYKKFLMMVSLPLFHEHIYAQISVLIILQVMEIVRFCLTMPFTSKLKNLFRLSMEIVLLLIFVLILSSSYLSGDLMKNSTKLE